MSATREPAGREPAGGEPKEPPAGADYARLDDAALISLRWQVREELEREPDNMADLVWAHHLMTVEILRRARVVRERGPARAGE